MNSATEIVHKIATAGVVIALLSIAINLARVLA